jgi:plasmid stabilization system protein ParE
MSGFRLTPTAKAHLADIWTYSETYWGADRADRYLRAIDAKLHKTAQGLVALRPCPEYGERLHFVLTGSHVIFVRRDEGAGLLVVVGVLHQSMSPSQHLTDED